MGLEARAFRPRSRCPRHGTAGRRPYPRSRVLRLPRPRKEVEIARPIRSQRGIDVMQACRVVLMERRRHEDGIEVDRVDAEVLQIIELRAKADEVATIATAVDGLEEIPLPRLPRLLPIPILTPRIDRPPLDGMIKAIRRLGIAAGRAVTKALREYLIPDGIARPRGHLGTYSLGGSRHVMTPVRDRIPRHRALLKSRRFDELDSALDTTGKCVRIGAGQFGGAS